MESNMHGILITDEKKTRFSQGFPLIYSLLHTHYLFLMSILLLLALAAGFFYSIHLALGIIFLFYLILAVKLELKQLNSFLITPLISICIYNLNGLGIGINLILMDSNIKFDPYYFEYQLGGVIAILILIFSYYVSTNSKNVTVPVFSQSSLPPDVHKVLRFTAWVLFTFAIFNLLIGAITGSGDRGDAGAFIVDQKYGIWSIFTMFSRFNYVGMFFVPFLIQIETGAKRNFVLIILSFYLLVCFASGSRGSFLYPFIYIGLGYWFFGGSAKVIKKAFVLFLAMSFFVIPLLVNFRSLDSFSSSALSNPLERLSGITQIENQKDSNSASNLLLTGLSLLGCVDQIIYEKTPKIVPHAGFEGIERVFFFLIPAMIMPTKPLLLDGDEISALYSGISSDRSSACTTFNGDMYRRFSWLGIVGGNILFGIFYGKMFVFCTWIFHKKNYVFGLLLLILTTTFFQAIPMSTMLTTFWIWLWDMPKYFITLYALCRFSMYHYQINRIPSGSEVQRV